MFGPTQLAELSKDMIAVGGVRSSAGGAITGRYLSVSTASYGSQILTIRKEFMADNRALPLVLGIALSVLIPLILSLLLLVIVVTTWGSTVTTTTIIGAVLPGHSQSPSVAFDLHGCFVNIQRRTCRVT